MSFLDALGPAGPILAKKIVQDYQVQQRPLITPAEIQQAIQEAQQQAFSAGASAQVVSAVADGKRHVAVIVSTPLEKGLDRGSN